MAGRMMTHLEQAEFLARMFLLHPEFYSETGEIIAIKELYKEVVRQREYIETLEKVITMSEGFISDIERILQSKGVQND